MGRILFAAPGIERFHLHQRLARELRQRGHEVAMLHVDRPPHTFWAAQGEPGVWLAPERADRMRAPLREFAELEAARLGHPRGSRRHGRIRRRIERRLAGILPPLVRWLSHYRPGLVLCHGQRTAERRLVQFVARELGSRVLWTGAGLLPHTMQVDERGLDGEASSLRREAFDYRAVPRDPALLDASLANMLAHTTPFALTRQQITAPPLRRRLQDALQCAGSGLAGARYAIHGWQRATPPAAPTPGAFSLPTSPFVAVLLQSHGDERVRLDAEQPPTPLELVLASARATRALDPALRTLAILPAGGLHHRELRSLLRVPGVTIAPGAAAIEATATAVATTTINHPLAIAAMLAGTPVLHSGRALWGLPTVTHNTPTELFAAALQHAVSAPDTTTLRQRLLTWLIGHTHLWCSPELPDHNGLVGLVQEIERRLGERRPRGLAFHYRSGPAWPLSV